MSTVDKIIALVMKNNITIIEVTVALIIIFSLYLAFKYFINEDPAQQGGAGTDLSQLEETLKKLLDQKASSGLSAEDAAAYEALKMQVTELKNQVEAKQKEIEDAQANQGKGSGMSEEEKNQLNQKLRELESKLSEYEIISEDIADLSKYKEENVKLKSQLDVLKKSPAAAAAAGEEIPAFEAAPEPEPEPEPMPEPIPEPEVPAPDLTAAETPAAPNYIDDDIMNEFAKAVEMQQSGALPNEAPKAPVVEEPVAAPEPEPVAEVEEPAALNLEKMDAEAETIQIAAETADPEANSLEGDMNEDKLISEATQFGAEVNDDANVMNQFNNFVKSDNSR